MSTASLLSSLAAGNGSARATPRTDPPCIDLAEHFGQQYRVEHEQHGRGARVNVPWLKIIPCQAGHVCPWGRSTLAAVTDKAGPIARKLAALPGAILWQDGSDGATVVFDVALFPQVAKIMRPRRCRRLNPEQRAKLVQAGAKHRFRTGAQTRPEPRPCVQAARIDSEAVQATSAILGAYDAPRAALVGGAL
jgi:hypothetical protein